MLNPGLPIDEGFPAYVPEARAFVVTLDPSRAWLPGSDPTGDGTAVNVRALSQVCPHLGCRPNPCVEDFWFHCPCHQSRYDRHRDQAGRGAVRAGRPIDGPPPDRGERGWRPDRRHDPGRPGPAADRARAARRDPAEGATRVRRVSGASPPPGGRLLRLYPRSWRERYEDEMLALLDAASIGWRGRRRPGPRRAGRPGPCRLAAHGRRGARRGRSVDGRGCRRAGPTRPARLAGPPPRDARSGDRGGPRRGARPDRLLGSPERSGGSARGRDRGRGRSGRSSSGRSRCWLASLVPRTWRPWRSVRPSAPLAASRWV